MSRRTDRLESVLQGELSFLIARRLRDPRLGMASVSGVQMSSDLRHARVRVSVLGDDEEARLETIATLEHAAPALRHMLTERVELRVAPELHFELDRGAEHSLRIAELLEKDHADDDT